MTVVLNTVAKNSKFSSTERSEYKENLPGMYPIRCLNSRNRVTTSSPSTSAEPESGSSREVKILKRLVLPPPSGPINPKSSPSSTSKEIFDRAGEPLYFLQRSRTATTLRFEVCFTGHPDFYAAVVSHSYLNGVHKIYALFAGLYDFWSKLCFCRNPINHSTQGRHSR